MKKVYLPTTRKTVLIIDHDELVTQVYRETLQNGGFTVVIVGDRNGAMAQIGNGQIGLIILDLSIPGMNAIELLGDIRSAQAGSRCRSSCLPILSLGKWSARLSTPAPTGAW
jgi:DNA-binding response OmpR family regulator